MSRVLGWWLFWCALGFLVAACHPDRPHWHTWCAESHVEQRWVYWPSEAAGFGITPSGAGWHLGGGLHLVSETVCDRADSALAGPGE